ncbi:MAG: hypothetical protein EPO24_12005 [Bacteroidetes bacterium]|nr:MAG: hypothetical protein EPO24_12005 [Bacteroidota bacterium]
MKMIFSILNVIIFVCCFTGCKGDKGDPGIAGLQDEVGTANVFYSHWFSPSAWQGYDTNWYFDTVATGITQAIIDSGVVLAFMKMEGDSVEVRPLPATPTAEFIFLVNYVIPTVGKIRFTLVTNTDLMLSLNTKFRYVIIPGGSSLGKRGIAMLNSYKELIKYYHIPN